ncbi:hypothetical protein Vafri_11900 [Volvox africanus]|uniref:Uncharacterized protein n=1 Tax=Volvox africanus TaxID=51714 RepID=A0A8J4B9Y5_9CHLO|nr:hypothetical protein Vafri_11900 [Volvox africanus]
MASGGDELGLTGGGSQADLTTVPRMSWRGPFDQSIDRGVQDPAALPVLQTPAHPFVLLAATTVGPARNEEQGRPPSSLRQGHDDGDEDPAYDAAHVDQGTDVRSPTAATTVVRTDQGRSARGASGTGARVSTGAAGTRSGTYVVSNTSGKVVPARVATPPKMEPAVPAAADSVRRHLFRKVSNPRNVWAPSDTSDDSLVPGPRAADVANATVPPLPPLQPPIQASWPSRAATSTLQQRRSSSMDGWQRRAAVPDIRDGDMHRDRYASGLPAVRQHVCQKTSGAAECSVLEGIPAGAYKADKKKGALYVCPSCAMCKEYVYKQGCCDVAATSIYPHQDTYLRTACCCRPEYTHVHQAGVSNDQQGAFILPPADPTDPTDPVCKKTFRDAGLFFRPIHSRRASSCSCRQAHPIDLGTIICCQSNLLTNGS